MKNRFSVPLYIFLTYALTFTGGQLFYNRHLTEYFNEKILIIFKIIFIPAIMAPFSIALLLAFSENKKEGIKKLLARFYKKGIPLYWYLSAVFVPVLVHFLASILDSWRGTEFLPPFGNVNLHSLVSVLIIFVLAGIGEEMGWRGYLLVRLQQKFSSFFASIIVGLVTSFWHLPMFITESTIHSSHAFLPFMLLSIAFSFLYTWLMDNTKAVLIAALFHTFHDFASISFSFRDHLSSFYVYTIIAVIIVCVYGMKRFRKTDFIVNKEKI